LIVEKVENHIRQLTTHKHKNEKKQEEEQKAGS